MTDLTLLPEDKQELGDAIDRAVASGDIDGKIKDSFCGCWPTVKAILEWAQKLPVSQKIKDALAQIVEWGDLIHGKLCPNWRPAQ